MFFYLKGSMFNLSIHQCILKKILSSKTDFNIDMSFCHQISILLDTD